MKKLPAHGVTRTVKAFAWLPTYIITSEGMMLIWLESYGRVERFNTLSYPHSIKKNQWEWMYNKSL